MLSTLPIYCSRFSVTTVSQKLSTIAVGTRRTAALTASNFIGKRNTSEFAAASVDTNAFVESAKSTLSYQFSQNMSNEKCQFDANY